MIPSVALECLQRARQYGYVSYELTASQGMLGIVYTMSVSGRLRTQNGKVGKRWGRPAFFGPYKDPEIAIRYAGEWVEVMYPEVDTKAKE